MRLLVDAGNTRTKWAWQQALAQMDALDNSQLNTAGQPLLTAMAQASEIFISNVAGASWRDWFAAQALSAKVVWVTASAVALGVHNGYHQPQQLGSDRWCSLLAAWQRWQASMLVVSAGTALTIDALVARADSREADFIGGSIQPGLQLMWRSLQDGAAQLDYAPPQQCATGFAIDTPQAMWQGCLTALAAAIGVRYAALAAQLQSPPALVLTGGDAALLYTLLPTELSAQAVIVDNLVLSGLAALAAESGNTT